MSLNEERMLILKMLEEGKITSEEAARLIEALENSSAQSSGDNSAGKQQKKTNFQDEAAKVRERINEWRKDLKKNYNQKDFDRMVDEFSSKAEKLGKNVANTTFGIVDKVMDFVGSFVDTHAFNIFGSYKLVERQFETPAIEGSDVVLEAVNGHVLIKKHMDDKIFIRTKVRIPQNETDDVLLFSDSQNLVSLTLSRKNNLSVSHEVFLPAVKFNKVKVSSSNGKIYVEDALCQEFESLTKNAPIDLMGVSSDRIVVGTKNAKIELSYIIGKNIDINTNNSVIEIKNIKAEHLNAVTMNGRILVENAQNLKDLSEINLQLKTTNGGIKVNMNDMDNRGYKIKGKTSNGGINLLIPELIYYNINKQGGISSFVEAESNGYANYAERVNIYAETANGYIEVVK